MYVDLSPIRAAIAQTPEASDYTGAKDRLDDLKSNRIAIGHSTASSCMGKLRARSQSGWLSPIEINETSDLLGLTCLSCQVRMLVGPVQGLLEFDVEPTIRSSVQTSRRIAASSVQRSKGPWSKIFARNPKGRLRVWLTERRPAFFGVVVSATSLGDFKSTGRLIKKLLRAGAPIGLVVFSPKLVLGGLKTSVFSGRTLSESFF